jgi:hypothetical protein
VVDAVQLEAAGGEVDIASEGEADILRRQVGRLGQLLAGEVGGLVRAGQRTCR